MSFRRIIMIRKDIYTAIEIERISQDSKWPRDDRRKQMYSFSAAHLLVLEQKIESMRKGWYNGEISKDDFIKVAAIAVRALEEITDEKFLEKE